MSLLPVFALAVSTWGFSYGFVLQRDSATMVKPVKQSADVAAAASAAALSADTVGRAPLQVASKSVNMVRDAVVSKQTKSTSAMDLHSIEDAESRLQAVMPIKWLHVPKTGTGFLNTIVHHKSICPDTGDTTLLAIGEDTPTVRSNHPDLHVIDVDEDHSWKRTCEESGGLLGPRIASHFGIEDEYEQIKGGHAMTMLRNPRQRVISGYHDHHNFCYEPYCTDETPLKKYAEATQGCVAKLLTRGGYPCFYGTEESMAEVTPEELDEARRRLREDFAFVGLTDEYSLSVCLFHKMFGGECSRTESINVHSTGARAHKGYNESYLKEFVDYADGALYDDANATFWKNLELYNVTRESCEAMCAL